MEAEVGTMGFIDQYGNIPGMGNLYNARQVGGNTVIGRIDDKDTPGIGMLPKGPFNVLGSDPVGNAESLINLRLQVNRLHSTQN